MEAETFARMSKLGLAPKPSGPAAPAGYKYSTPPGPPPIRMADDSMGVDVTPAAKGTYVQPKHVIVTLSDSTDDNPALEGSLQSRGNGLQISGPIVANVLCTLKNQPKEKVNEFDIAALNASIIAAEKEAEIVCNLPQVYKDVAAAKLVDLRNKLDKLEKTDEDDNEPRSFAILDKNRATLVAQRDAWVTRVSARKQAVYEETKHATKAIDDAQDALASQKSMLQEHLDGHQAAWDTHNIKETFATKISKITQKCESKFVAMNDGSDSDNDDKVIEDL
jgi:hypothetical protein